MAGTWFIAERYFRTQGGRHHARLLCTVAVLSLALAVCAAGLMQGFMQGFHEALEVKLMGTSPHIEVTLGKNDAVAWDVWRNTHPQGTLISPLYRGEIIMQVVGDEGFSDLGMRIVGLDAAALARMTSTEFVIHDDDVSLNQLFTNRNGFPPAIFGSEAFLNLGLHALPPQDIVLRATAPLATIDSFGNLQPLQRNFRSAGFFHSGIFVEDSQVVFVATQEAKRVLGYQAQPAWALFVDGTPDDIEALAQSVREQLSSGARVTTWRDNNRQLFRALDFEALVMRAILIVMLMIASISIFAVVAMQMMARARDIAVLRALGATAQHTRRLVLQYGIAIGACGVALGIGLFALIARILEQWPIVLPPSFYVPVLPLHVSIPALVGIAVLALVAACMAALLPAWRMAALSPAEGLRCDG